MSSITNEQGKCLDGAVADMRPPAGWLQRVRFFSSLMEVNSSGIIRRVGLLFITLCLIKLVMLVGFRKHLFEVHWRVATQPLGVVNDVAFLLFAILTGLNLWVLGRRCMTAGIGTVRWANACVLVLGAVFICLTLHEGNRNYLHPVMNGVLTFKSLGWYFACAFLFQSPFLGAWLFGYAAIYYILVRTRREHWALGVTALCAAAYVGLCCDLIHYSNALIIIDCVGIACFFCMQNAKRGLGLVWVGLLLSGVVFTFVVFAGTQFGWTLGELDPEFLILSAGSIVILGGVTLFAWRRRFLAYWSWILPFALVAFLLMLNVNYPLAANYNNLLCTGFTLCRYFLGDLLIASGLFVAALAYRRWRSSGSLWWLDVLCLLLTGLALADLRLAQIMGARLDWDAFSLALGETPTMMWRMAKPYLPAVLGLLLVIAIMYATAIRVARRFDGGRILQKRPQLVSGVFFFLLLFLLLGCAGTKLIKNDKAEGQCALLLAETSPLWQRTANPPMDRDSFVRTAESLGMNEITAQRKPVSLQVRREMNVVLILQESTYNKYLSLFGGAEETQPLLAKYKDRMELFPNFYANFAGSINARFATFTGLYPVQDYKSFTVQRVDVKSVFELLHDQGYSCSLFYSSFFDYTGFRDFLRGRQLDEMYDADTMPGGGKASRVSWGLQEDDTLGAIRTRINDYAARKEKFFLTYIPAAPHNPFDGTPARFCKFQRKKVNDLTPLYLNELVYMDSVISSIVDQLRTSGLLDNTLVIITSDHGELLGEGGGQIGHGWAVNPELSNVPLIVMNPSKSGCRTNSIIGSQVDLLPTIMDALGIALPSTQLYQGSSLYSVQPSSDRTVYLSSFSQYGIVKGRQFVFGERQVSGAGDQNEKVFTIDGQKSLHEAEFAIAGEVPSIMDFDRFQENFLRNYSHYCELFRVSLTVRKENTR